MNVYGFDQWELLSLTVLVGVPIAFLVGGIHILWKDPGAEEKPR